MAKAQPLLAVDPQGLLGDNAPQILYTRFSEVIFFAHHVHDPSNVAQLHAMRIAAKRLRYTLEIFIPAYEYCSGDYRNLVEHAKQVQEKIGEIHDCDVRIAQIGEYLNQHIAKKPEIQVGLQSLIDRERRTRHSLYESFIQYWSELQRDSSFESKFVSVIFGIRNRPAKPPTTSSAE
jgi:CHAD domain-containing protein